MSRPIGAVFHLPHGLSNAILLPTVTRFSVGAASERYATIARTAGCADHSASAAQACDLLITWLDELNAALELPRLSKCHGVDRTRFDAEVARMAADALASGSPANNPRVPTAEEIIALYCTAW